MIVALVAICFAEEPSAPPVPLGEASSEETSSAPTQPTSAAGAPAAAPERAAPAPPSGAAATPAPAPAPGAAATAASAAESAAEAAEAGAPASADDTAGVPDAPEEPARDRLSELALVRVDTEDGWGVSDGRGKTVDARTLAILAGDASLLARIEAQRKKGRTLGYGLLIGGGAVAVSSVAPLFTLEEALSVDESSDDFDAIGARNDVRVATAFSLLGAGVLLAGSGLAANAIADRKALEVPRYFDPAEADAILARYNARLGDALAVAPPPPTPTGDVPPELEAPAEPAAVPATPEAPAAAPAPAPGAP